MRCGLAGFSFQPANLLIPTLEFCLPTVEFCLRGRQFAPYFLKSLLLSLELASRVCQPRLTLTAFALGFLRTAAQAVALSFDLAGFRLRRRHLTPECRERAPGFLVRLLFSLQQTSRVGQSRLNLVAFSLGFLRTLAPAGTVSFDRLLFGGDPPPGFIQSIVISFQSVQVDLQGAGAVDLNVQRDGEDSRDDGCDAGQNLTGILRQPGQRHA